MIDPGAIGTLLIGLRANGASLDFGFDDDRRPARSPRRQQRLLALSARAMRRLADRLDPVPLEVEPAS